MPVSEGTAHWSGDIPTGAGEFTAGASIKGGYTYKSRFEGGIGSNPEQLIAAAHAACFTMALANVLAEAGHPAQDLNTTARVTLRPLDGIPTISRIELSTTGVVAGIEPDKFAEFAATAKAGCPVSRALSGVPEIVLEASLI